MIYIPLSFMCAKQPIQQAVDYFLALPNNHDIAKYRISDQKWAAMKDVEFILSVSHKVGRKT